MPNFGNKIENRTVGDAFSLIRTIGGIPSGITVEHAYLTVMSHGSSDTKTTYLFQKHITTTESAAGLIDNETAFSIVADGIQVAGDTELTVEPLPTTLDAGTVIQFNGGTWATVSERALQGATSVKVNSIDSPIADGETAEYKTVRIRFKIAKEDSVLIKPNKLHPYDIQLTMSNGDPFTFEDGTINLRPQRTIGV
jgi:hypothetical protein